MIRPTTLLLLCALSVFPQEHKQDHKVVYTKQEQPLVVKVRGLQELPDGGFRGVAIKNAALEIRSLPPSLNKLRLADSVAFVAAEGDPGPDTLQEVAATLTQAMREQPGKLESAYTDLAYLAHYEHVKVSLDDRKFAAAVANFEAEDQRRREVNFSLPDLNGKTHTLKDLRGKVVLVNFWAPMNRSCWQEMTDLEGLYQKFKKQDLVILGIGGDKRELVASFVKAQKITFPVMPDPDQKVAQLYRIVGTPKTFVYDREGKLVAQAMNARSQRQLQDMLSQAGLR